MKRLLSFLLMLLMFLSAGCGGSEPSAPLNSPSQTPETTGAVLSLQDPSAFLGGSTLAETEPGATGIQKLTFTLAPEEDVLALQYADLLLNGAYQLEQADRVESENDTTQAYACYFRYTGDRELPVLDMKGALCHLFIGIRRDNGERTTFTLIYPEGISFADWGARANRSGLPSSPASSPQPSASPSPSPTPNVTTDPVNSLAQYPAPTVFLYEETPDTYRELEHGATEWVFVFEKGKGAWGRQYVNALTEGPYQLTLTGVEEVEAAKVTFEYYYLDYTGIIATKGLKVNDTSCSICVKIANYQNRDETHVQVSVADGFQAVNRGERADLTVLNTPKPTPAPPTPVPSTKPTPTGPSVIPDFLANDPSGAFRAGNSAFDGAVCFLADDTTYYSAAETYVQLLIDMGYTLSSTDEKAMRTWSRMQWDLYYEGADWPPIGDNTHVRVKHLASNRDGVRKTEISITYSEGITYGGEEQYRGGGGGSIGGGSWDPNLPDHSKLQCLTCDGSGDCPSCGGYGEKTRGGITSDCTRCDRGKCPTCHGNGTR